MQCFAVPSRNISDAIASCIFSIFIPLILLAPFPKWKCADYFVLSMFYLNIHFTPISSSPPMKRSDSYSTHFRPTPPPPSKLRLAVSNLWNFNWNVYRPNWVRLFGKVGIVIFEILWRNHFTQAGEIAFQFRWLLQAPGMNAFDARIFARKIASAIVKRTNNHLWSATTTETRMIIINGKATLTKRKYW